MFSMLVYALAIFSGAFLLFQVQPMMGKYILPWFGGGPGVWTTCMLFFQVVLVGGYGYAHFLTRHFQPRTQGMTHLVLVCAALLLLPVTPNESWKPMGDGNPTLQILALLLTCLGLPYLILSATGPLMQQWFSQTHPQQSPYRLYALSNVGSLLALISYPLFFETHFTRKSQMLLWGWGLVGYALCCGFCALKLWRDAATVKSANNTPVPEKKTPAGKQVVTPNPNPPIAAMDRVLWLLLPACASGLLLATTNKACQDVAVIPFLWVIPLALYLLSFIICFDNPRWYARYPFSLALIAGLGGIAWTIYSGYNWPIWRQVTMYFAGFFACAMVCHGELYRLRPDPRQLTGFYLMISIGGALGGIMVAVIAPLVFTGYFELHFGLLLCALLFLVVCRRDRNPAELPQWQRMAWTFPFVVLAALDQVVAWFQPGNQTGSGAFFSPLRMGLWAGAFVLIVFTIRSRTKNKKVQSAPTLLKLVCLPWLVKKESVSLPLWRNAATTGIAIGTLLLGTTLWLQREKFADKTLVNTRNFYGVLRVMDHTTTNSDEHVLWLRHGHITHGCQLSGLVNKQNPTLYFSRKSGVGLAMQAVSSPNRRIGIVGLGAGTLAAYGQPGDSLRFYEINPEMCRLASSPFSFLADCQGQTELVLGDARISLEREPAQQFDLLVLDAFSSDAIPVHLLTLEAFELYGRHVKTNGVIAVHISNNCLNLEPVLANVAQWFDFQMVVVDHTPEPDQWWNSRSIWVVLSRNSEVFHTEGFIKAGRPALAGSAKVPLWTDDFSSLYQILK
jgi:spermidine synthase